jgi:hypothetical protein
VVEGKEWKRTDRNSGRRVRAGKGLELEGGRGVGSGGPHLKLSVHLLGCADHTLHLAVHLQALPATQIFIHKSSTVVLQKNNHPPKIPPTTL